MVKINQHPTFGTGTSMKVNLQTSKSIWQAHRWRTAAYNHSSSIVASLQNRNCIIALNLVEFWANGFR